MVFVGSEEQTCAHRRLKSYHRGTATSKCRQNTVENNVHRGVQSAQFWAMRFSLEWYKKRFCFMLSSILVAYIVVEIPLVSDPLPYGPQLIPVAISSLFADHSILHVSELPVGNITMRTESASQNSGNKIAKTGLYISSTLLLTLTAATVPFLRRYTGAPYVASAPHSREAIRRFLQAQKHLPYTPHQPRLTDLGAGSGELVIDAAKMGYIARGVELNIWLVLRSRFRAISLPEPTRSRVSFQRRDLWTCGLHAEDAIVVFGVPAIMGRLGELILAECKDECVVCSNTFPVPGWAPLSRSGGVWFYNVGDQKSQGGQL